ncbi:MAG: aminotransferase class I/II-fold pyridoxal phosphate-dependent enzyme [bacterium]|nr:aminotransferase class I/II-fold pyridoxal phosphate-dependent enzyme [bacterium]
MSVAKRLQPFGETIFTTITQLAVEHDAINLGQGFPNFDGPEFVKDAATEAIARGENQYPRSFGIGPLVEAIAARFAADSGLTVDPFDNVTVTSGCTEALAAACLGLIEPGDEVVLIEPTYDAYRPDVALAGGIPRYVTLRAPDFRLDPDELRAVFSSRTKAIIINTPHNPTGRVFSPDELELVASLCREYDTIAITDEVYDHMVFDGGHLSLAALDGMWERTITLSSLGKTFSLTGWKVGWAIGPEPLTAGVRAAHQFLTFTTASPLQHGAAAALQAGDSYYDELTSAYKSRRDLLASGLSDLGFAVFVPQGTYFMLADHTRFGFDDDVAFVRHLITETGVAAIPPSAFYHRPSDGASLVRFAFCKDKATLAAALDRMAKLGA